MAVCEEERLLVEEAIAVGSIPFPNRIPEQRPLFDIKVDSVAAPFEAAQSTRLPSLEPLLIDTNLDEVAAAVCGRAGQGRVVLVGSRAEAAGLAAAITQRGLNFLRLDPAYGQGQGPIAEGFLQKPERGSFLWWLLWSQYEWPAGAVVFLNPSDSTDDLIALMDAGAPPAFIWDMAGCRLDELVEHQTEEWPRITVVTPSFNQAKFIEATIKSVLDQNYPNLEYIIVDAGSTDGSIQIIDRYRDRIAHVIVEPDEGQSDALNKGFALATGELMNWLCSDDLLEPGALYSIARAYRRDKPDLIAGGCVRIGETRDEVLFYHHNSILFGQSVPFDPSQVLRFMRSWQKGYYFFQPEVFFSRRIWLASGAFLKKHLFYVMDYDLWLRMALAGANIRHLPVLIGCSRQHSEQKTQNSSEWLHQVQQLLPEYSDLFEALSRTLSAQDGASAAPSPLSPSPKGRSGALFKRWKAWTGGLVSPPNQADRPEADVNRRFAKVEARQSEGLEGLTVSNSAPLAAKTKT
jgi:GT2 family glycosyltransferase